MSLTNVATVMCTDVDSGDEAVVIVRAAADCVGLCLSLRGNGDTEVFLSVADARQVVAALQGGVARAAAEPSAGEGAPGEVRDQRSNVR